MLKSDGNIVKQTCVEVLFRLVDLQTTATRWSLVCSNREKKLWNGKFGLKCRWRVLFSIFRSCLGQMHAVFFRKFWLENFE